MISVGYRFVFYVLVAHGIECRVDATLYFAVRLRGNDGIGSMELGIFSDRIAVVASIGEQHLRVDIVCRNQCVICSRFVRFARRDDEAEWETFTVVPVWILLVKPPRERPRP